MRNKNKGNKRKFFLRLRSMSIRLDSRSTLDKEMNGRTDGQEFRRPSDVACSEFLVRENRCRRGSYRPRLSGMSRLHLSGTSMLFFKPFQFHSFEIGKTSKAV